MIKEINKLDLVSAYIEIDGVKNYCGLFETKEDAINEIQHRVGNMVLVNVDEKELESALQEESNSSDWEDIVKVLRLISPKMHKIESQRCHDFYNKYSKEFVKDYLEEKPLKYLINVKDKLIEDSKNFDNLILVDGVYIQDTTIVEIMEDILSNRPLER